LMLAAPSRRVLRIRLPKSPTSWIELNLFGPFA
jgi:hypothetical protein